MCPHNFQLTKAKTQLISIASTMMEGIAIPTAKIPGGTLVTL